VIDHRLLQRTLFRMQLDSAFATRVFEREPEALASTGLAEADLTWILAADPIAISADPGGRRLSQLIGNVVAEYVASVSLMVERLGFADIASAFASSPEFHAAIRFDDSLPVGFGAYAARRLEPSGEGTIESVLTLERALVDARRGPREVAKPAAGQVVLAGCARLIELRAGTFELLGQLATDSSCDRVLEPESEHLLLKTGPPAHVGALYRVDVEVLSESVRAVLRAAEQPLDGAGREALARSRGVEPEELSDFLRSLREEGLLEGGR